MEKKEEKVKVWYRPEEFAKAVGVSIYTVRRRIREGKIRNIRKDGYRIVLIHVSEIERYGEWDKKNSRGKKPSFNFPL